MELRETVPAKDEAHQALELALAGYFAAQQLSAQSLAYFYGSSVPTTLLWLNSWRPLPDLVAWFAALGWGLCVVMAVALAAIAAKRRAQADAALPGASRVGQVHSAAGDGPPFASMLLFVLSILAGSVLWINGLAPHVLRGDTVLSAGRAWIVLLAGAIVNRLFERW